MQQRRFIFTPKYILVIGESACRYSYTDCLMITIP